MNRKLIFLATILILSMLLFAGGTKTEAKANATTFSIIVTEGKNFKYTFNTDQPSLHICLRPLDGSGNFHDRTCNYRQSSWWENWWYTEMKGFVVIVDGKMVTDGVITESQYGQVITFTIP